MLDSITVAEAAHLLIGNDPPGVQILGRMDLQIEANKKNRKETSDARVRPRKEISRCNYCKRLGHSIEDCRIRDVDMKRKKFRFKEEVKIEKETEKKPVSTA